MIAEKGRTWENFARLYGKRLQAVSRVLTNFRFRKFADFNSIQITNEQKRIARYAEGGSDYAPCAIHCQNFRPYDVKKFFITFWKQFANKTRKSIS